MSSVVIAGDTSGTVTLAAPAVSGTTTLTLPTTSGTLITTATSQTLTSPVFAGTPTGVGVLTATAAVTLSSTSTSLITSIPTWVKRVTLVCNGAAQNSTDYLLVRLNGVTTGYTSTALATNTGAGTASATTGMLIYTGTVSNLNFTGSMTLYNQTGNTWVQSHTGIGVPFSPNSGLFGGGVIALAAALSSISITTFNGTATLSGSITVLYE